MSHRIRLSRSWNVHLTLDKCLDPDIPRLSESEWGCGANHRCELGGAVTKAMTSPPGNAAINPKPPRSDTHDMASRIDAAAITTTTTRTPLIRRSTAAPTTADAQTPVNGIKVSSKRPDIVNTTTPIKQPTAVVANNAKTTRTGPGGLPETSTDSPYRRSPDRRTCGCRHDASVRERPPTGNGIMYRLRSGRGNPSCRIDLRNGTRPLKRTRPPPLHVPWHRVSRPTTARGLSASTTPNAQCGQTPGTAQARLPRTSPAAKRSGRPSGAPGPPHETAHRVSRTRTASSTSRHTRFSDAFKYSRFNVLMLSSGMPFGHADAHSPVKVQPPNPASSIASTMSSTRV